jgi:hypothetical protein
MALQRETPQRENCGARNAVCLEANSSPNSRKHFPPQAQFERLIAGLVRERLP